MGHSSLIWPNCLWKAGEFKCIFLSVSPEGAWCQIPPDPSHHACSQTRCLSAVTRNPKSEPAKPCDFSDGTPAVNWTCGSLGVQPSLLTSGGTRALLQIKLWDKWTSDGHNLASRGEQCSDPDALYLSSPGPDWVHCGARQWSPVGSSGSRLPARRALFRNPRPAQTSPLSPCPCFFCGSHSFPPFKVFPLRALNHISFRFCRCERHARSQSGRWLVGGGRYERPLVESPGKVVGWYTGWGERDRPFAIDMAGEGRGWRGFAPAGLFPPPLVQLHWRRMLWKTHRFFSRLYYVQQMNYLTKPSTTTQGVIQGEINFGVIKRLIPLCHLSTAIPFQGVGWWEELVGTTHGPGFRVCSRSSLCFVYKSSWL